MPVMDGYEATRRLRARGLRRAHRRAHRARDVERSRPLPRGGLRRVSLEARGPPAAARGRGGVPGRTQDRHGARRAARLSRVPTAGPRMELVIFDCDGVLVDSEPISNRVLAECLTGDRPADDARRVAARLQRPLVARVRRALRGAPGRSAARTTSARASTRTRSRRSSASSWPFRGFTTRSRAFPRRPASRRTGGTRPCA